MELNREFWKRPEGTAVLWASASGVITHLFGLVNTMHNYDNMPQQPGGLGTGIPSGRWFLEILKSIADWCQMDFNLPVVNGLLLIGLLAVAAGFAVNAFGIRSRWSAAMVGMLFVVFPTVTSTMFFRFTAQPYGLGILLAVLAAWVLPKKWGIFWSALFTAMSLGIYQAYAPITISIFVIQLLKMTLEGDKDAWTVVRKGLYDCAALVLGLVCYYLLLEFFLMVYGEELNNYQGMQDMGKISLTQLPGLIKQAYRDFCLMPFEDYCGLAHTKLLKLLYLLLALFSGVMVGATFLLKVKNWLLAALGGVLCALLPLAVNFVVVMCPQSRVYTLMVYSFVLVPCIPLVLWEELPEMAGRGLLVKAVGVVTAVLIFCYGYYANVNYSAQYYANYQAGNYVNAIVTQVRMTEGFDTEKKWAFLGKIDDPLMRFTWEDGVVYGGNKDTMGLLRHYSWYSWFYNYLGYWVPRTTDEETAEISQRQEVMDMPCWPNQGAIQIFDEIIVIKFS